jgi:putative transposase
MDYQRDEHRIHLIIYHLVWCPMRRKKVLLGSVAKDLDSLILQKCSEHGWEVLNLAIQPDHVHLFVRVFPTNSAAFVLNQCKGATSKILRDKYPNLRKIPSLWTSSYFASTAGNVSQETIQKYIEAQKGL